LDYSSVPKAVLKPPHSKRWRDCPTTSGFAERLECGVFTAAFPRPSSEVIPFEEWAAVGSTAREFELIKAFRIRVHPCAPVVK
jgi:hypothetical protein